MKNYNKNQKNKKPENDSLDKNNKNTHNQGSNSLISNKKILLFPGENYEFNENLIHYDIFGYSKENLIAKKCSILNLGKFSLFNLYEKATKDNNLKIIGNYYNPRIDDFVIGTVIQKNPEFYKVDIGTYTLAILNTKDFEGASKKTKPNINMGDLVFARVLKVNKFDAPILSCISQFDVKNWASGESFFGQLKNGMVFDFPLKDASSFISSENYVLNRLNDVISFEIVFGHNGKMWINSEDDKNIFKLFKVLEKSVGLEKEGIEKMINDTFNV